MSNEYRPQPIIEIRIFIDKNSIPMAYKLFASNTNDKITLLPIKKRLLGEKQVKDKNETIQISKERFAYFGSKNYEERAKHNHLVIKEHFNTDT